jgi:DNA binding domain, excisionase family
MSEDRDTEEGSVSLQGAARRLSACDRTVRREIARGRLRAFRVGRHWRIRVSELRQYMEREAVTL